LADVWSAVANESWSCEHKDLVKTREDTVTAGKLTFQDKIQRWTVVSRRESEGKRRKSWKSDLKGRKSQGRVGMRKFPRMIRWGASTPPWSCSQPDSETFHMATRSHPHDKRHSQSCRRCVTIGRLNLAPPVLITQASSAVSKVRYIFCTILQPNTLKKTAADMNLN
jgi:hypothetical protein